MAPPQPSLSEARDHRHLRTLLQARWESEDSEVEREDDLREALWVAVEHHPRALRWLFRQPGARDLLRDDDLQRHLFQTANATALEWWSRQARSCLPRPTGYRELLDALVIVDCEYSSWCRPPERFGGEYLRRLLTELDALVPHRYRRAIEAALWTEIFTEARVLDVLQGDEVYELDQAETLFSLWHRACPDLPWHQLRADDRYLRPAYAMALMGKEVPARLIQQLMEYARPHYEPHAYASLEECHRAWQFILEDLAKQWEPYPLLQTLLELEGPDQTVYLLGAMLLVGVDYWETDEFAGHLARLVADYPVPLREALHHERVHGSVLEHALSGDEGPIVRHLVQCGCPDLCRWLPVAYDRQASRCLSELLQLPTLQPEYVEETYAKMGNGPSVVELPLVLHRGSDDPGSVQVLLAAIAEHWPSVRERLSREEGDLRVGALLRAAGRSPTLTLRLLQSLIVGPGLGAPRSIAEHLLRLAGHQMEEVDWEQALLSTTTDGVSADPESLVAWLWAERHSLGLGPEVLLRLLIEHQVSPEGLVDDLTAEERDALQTRFGDLVATHPAQVASLSQACPCCTLADCVVSDSFLQLCRSATWTTLIPIQDQWVYPGLLVYHCINDRRQRIGRVLLVGLERLSGTRRVGDDVRTFARRPLTTRQKDRCRRLAEEDQRRRRSRAKSAQPSKVDA